MIDFVLPDGTAVPITIGDYRQLSDALFHAGTDSGSEYEYVDAANRLHFYVLDAQRDTPRRPVLHGRGPVARRRGPAAARRATCCPAAGHADRRRLGTCLFPVRNTGRPAAPAGGHPEDVGAYLSSDVYRLTAAAGATAGRSGCRTARDGAVRRDRRRRACMRSATGGSRVGRIRLTATSRERRDEVRQRHVPRRGALNATGTPAPEAIRRGRERFHVG